jgi:hypothetical protein
MHDMIRLRILVANNGYFVLEKLFKFKLLCPRCTTINLGVPGTGTISYWIDIFFEVVENIFEISGAIFE